MDILNESEFTIDEITHETLMCVKLTGKRLLFYLILVLTVMALGVTALILELMNNKSVTDSIVIICSLSIIILLLGYFKFFYPKTIKKSYVKNFGGNILFKYNFHINRLEVETTSVNASSKGVFKYDSLTKVVESPKVMRFYIQKRSFLPVRKDNFNPNDFPKLKKALIDSNVKYREVKR